MPVYDYCCPAGHAFSRHDSVDKFSARRRCPTCRKYGMVDIVAQHRGFQKPVNARWPLLSNAMSVLPSQVEEARAAAKEFDVPIRYNSQGQAIFTSEKNRRACLRARAKAGFARRYDRSGYGLT
jgi:hypothetical protein